LNSVSTPPFTPELCLYEKRTPASLLNRLQGLFRSDFVAAIVDRDQSTIGCQPTRDFLPDSPRSAGYQCGFACQFHHEFN
jgi:hypothetical protein